MGNTRYFLSNSREIPVFPAGMGNTHKSWDFANPDRDSTIPLLPKSGISTSCGSTARSLSALVGNPEDRFSHNEAHMIIILRLGKPPRSKRLFYQFKCTLSPVTEVLFKGEFV